MVEYTTVAIGVLLAVDIGYFVKTAVYVIGSRWLPKLHPLTKTNIYGICTTRDIDFMLDHKNNARYVRQMDFARLNHLSRIKMLDVSNLGQGSAPLLLTASTIRYRRSLHIFMPYKLESEIVYWDDKSIYFRQNFISLHDRFVRAAAYTKLVMVGKKPQDILEASASEKLEPLAVPEDVAHWIECMRLNSESLKPSS